MQLPPNPHRPTFRDPRDPDGWIIILAGLGLLGGTAGWLMVNSMSRPLLDSSPGAETATSSTPIVSGLGAEATVPPGTGTRPAPTVLPNSVPTPSPPNHSSIAPVPQAPVPGSPVPDAPHLSTPPWNARSQSSPAAVTVPEPQVPNSEGMEALPVIRDPLTFTDIPASYWAKPYIDALTARGIMNGLPDGSFAPQRPMTRAELAVKVANGFAIAPQKPPKAFTDVPADYWATATIQEAVQTGFMTGYPAGDFRPTQTVTRLQVLLALTAGLSLPKPNEAERLLQQYQDAGEIPTWARDSVAAAVAAGIITASPGTNYELRPTDPATRAEVAVIIYRALAYMGQVEPLP